LGSVEIRTVGSGTPEQTVTIKMQHLTVLRMHFLGHYLGSAQTKKVDSGFTGFALVGPIDADNNDHYLSPFFDKDLLP